jgi:hypothetical protein
LLLGSLHFDPLFPNIFFLLRWVHVESFDFCGTFGLSV